MPLASLTVFVALVMSITLVARGDVSLGFLCTPCDPALLPAVKGSLHDRVELLEQEHGLNATQRQIEHILPPTAESPVLCFRVTGPGGSSDAQLHQLLLMAGPLDVGGGPVVAAPQSWLRCRAPNADRCRVEVEVSASADAVQRMKAVIVALSVALGAFVVAAAAWCVFRHGRWLRAGAAVDRCDDGAATDMGRLMSSTQSVGQAPNALYSSSSGGSGSNPIGMPAVAASGFTAHAEGRSQHGRPPLPRAVQPPLLDRRLTSIRIAARAFEVPPGVLDALAAAPHNITSLAALATVEWRDLSGGVDADVESLRRLHSLRTYARLLSAKPSEPRRG